MTMMILALISDYAVVSCVMGIVLALAVLCDVIMRTHTKR
jgi:hypothetical protein